MTGGGGGGGWGGGRGLLGGKLGVGGGAGGGERGGSGGGDGTRTRMSNASCHSPFGGATLLNSCQTEAMSSGLSAASKAARYAPQSSKPTWLISLTTPASAHGHTCPTRTGGIRAMLVSTGQNGPGQRERAPGVNQASEASTRCGGLGMAWGRLHAEDAWQYHSTVRSRPRCTNVARMATGVPIRRSKTPKLIW